MKQDAKELQIFFVLFILLSYLGLISTGKKGKLFKISFKTCIY